jgi:Fur family ferric uptake transcriptional regulator
MAHKEEFEVLENFIRSKNLRRSEQRQQILDVFLKTEKHLTAEDLYNIVKKKNPSIGYATIYRSLKLFSEAGLCRELQVVDGTTRYEHLYNHKHHDHLICTKCGKFVEIESPEIEALQEKLAKKNGFELIKHRLELYGLCNACKN